MGKNMYFTIEFICDNRDDVVKLCKELQNKYPIFPTADSGTRTTMWIDGKCPDDSIYKEALINISNRAIRFDNATVQSMKKIAEEALGYNDD